MQLEGKDDLDSTIINEHSQPIMQSTEPSGPLYTVSATQEMGQHRFARAYSEQEDAIVKNYYATPPSHPPIKISLHRWFLVNTFAPQWLPKRLRYPFIGYLVAILLQGVVISGTALLMRNFSTIKFLDLLAVLVIIIIAINWGAIASFIATITGLILLDYFILSPAFSWNLMGIENVMNIVVFLLVGISISIGASQLERARRNANAERALLNAVIETVPDGIAIYDAKGRLVRMNSAGRQPTAPVTLDASNIAQLQHIAGEKTLRTTKGLPFPADQLPVACALRGEIVTSKEMIWQPSEDNKHYLTVSAAPLRDTWGKIGGAVSISHDISALRQSEHEVAVGSSELEAIFEGITDGVFFFSPNGHIQRMNTAFQELVGMDTQPNYFSLPLAERLTQFTLYNEDGQELPYEQWPQSRILRGEILKGATAADILFRASDNKMIYLSVSGAPVYMHDGQLIGGVAICRDTTEKRRLERYTHNALHSLLEMAQTLVDTSTSLGDAENASDIPASTVGQRLVEVTCSILQCKRVSMIAMEPKTRRLLPVAAVGLTTEQEHQWWEYTPGASLEEYIGNSTAVNHLNRGEVIILDTSHLLERSKVYTANQLLIAPMSIGDTFIGLLLLDYDDERHDYTYDKKALAGAVAKLATLVIERERLLRERAEAHASELALRESNSRMNEFLGIASHELKTPITTIKGSAQLLERRLKKLIDTGPDAVNERIRLQEEAQTLLRRTDIQVNRLTRLVNDLLDVSRIQSNKLVPRLEQCDLATIVRESVQEQRQISPTRTVRLELPADVEVPIYADADRIGQVVTNYLSNALKYSAEEKPVEVSLRIEDAETIVSVRDEGPGLASEEQEKLWDRFYRVKGVEVQSGSGVGLGLGLYICKTIIELHHGAVGVHSKQGEGSTFWFSLPLM